MLNAPDAIHRVLVDNPTNYRRTPATIRILRPITGKGMLLSEGDDWSHQRAYRPGPHAASMPMLARHIVTGTGRARDPRPRPAARRSDRAMQYLTLEIAGRSMFSMEMAPYGPACWRGTENGATRILLLDIVLPPSSQTARSGRQRFRPEWVGLMEEIMRPRKAPPPDAPRDLFDLMLAASDPQTGEGFSPDSSATRSRR